MEHGETIVRVDEKQGQRWEYKNPNCRLALAFARAMESTAKLFGIGPASRRGWTVPKSERSNLAQFRESLDDGDRPA